MTPPNFWTAPTPTPAARLLSPLGWAYAAATARRVARPATFRPDVPTICVGNLNAGGTGKTPTVIALLDRLAARGCRAAVVSRGYGGRLAGPVAVDPKRHSASDVGDEPLLLAAFAPVFVARDRAAGAKAAEAAGVDALILDDGFQNPDVARDLSLVVVDAEIGFGNGLCLPAGPLREPVAAGLGRADMLLSLGGAEAQAGFLRRWGTETADLPHLTGALAPLAMGMDWTGMRLFAFAGIGRPAKFFASLRAEGAILAGAEALADHQPLSRTLLARMARDAAAARAQLVATEKDAARLPPDWRGKVLTFPVRLRLDDPAPLDDRLAALGL